MLLSTRRWLLHLGAFQAYSSPSSAGDVYPVRNNYILTVWCFCTTLTNSGFGFFLQSTESCLQVMFADRLNMTFHDAPVFVYTHWRLGIAGPLSHKNMTTFKINSENVQINARAGRVLHYKDNLLVLVEKWQRKQPARRQGTQEGGGGGVTKLWFMAKHRFGSFCLAKPKSLNVKQCLKKKSGIKTQTAYFFRKKKLCKVLENKHDCIKDTGI